LRAYVPNPRANAKGRVINRKLRAADQNVARRQTALRQVPLSGILASVAFLPQCVARAFSTIARGDSAIRLRGLS
jgi:hypothetical protein